MQEMGKRKRDVGAGVGKWEAREGGSVGVAYIYLSFLMYVVLGSTAVCLRVLVLVYTYIPARCIHTYVHTYMTTHYA